MIQASVSELMPVPRGGFQVEAGGICNLELLETGSTDLIRTGGATTTSAGAALLPNK